LQLLLSVAQSEDRRKWAKPMLNFIQRNSKNLFLYKKLPEKRKAEDISPLKIDNTNNAAEIVFSLLKPQYKLMKQFSDSRWSTSSL